MIRLAASAVILGVGQTRLSPLSTSHGVAQAAVLPRTPINQPTASDDPNSTRAAETFRTEAAAEPKTVLMRSGTYFVYPRGCPGVRTGYNLVLHFHGAPSTVIPRYLKSGVDAVLVLVNKGIGSGAYSKALALPGQVDGLLSRVAKRVASECDLPVRAPRRLAISSWSAGYGATQQFLRLRPERVDAVLLSDGLHVGFSDERRRKVRVKGIQEFAEFAQHAARGEKLMAISHSSITPPQYAGAGETAMALAQSAHARCWPVHRPHNGMTQLSAASRGQFFVEGYAGQDKAAHAKQLYSIDKTLFARLKQYWSQ